VNAFNTAYVECALWASTDDEGEPLDSVGYTINDIDPATLKVMQDDCGSFQLQFGDKIVGRHERAGSDFWLTRNRHGAGFWDGDWTEHGDALTAGAHAFGSFDLYVGDDGKVYGT
jgi:hypothetical protein